jgi:catechol 2,3-dioxygenase-like lactoylglutathione lyase family enzyme
MPPTFNAIGIVTADMPASLAFYRKLGLAIPADADGAPHAEAELPGGVHLMWDPLETIHSFDPEFTPAKGDGRISLAFACADPAEVNATYAAMTAAGYEGHKPPWDAFWGHRYAVLRDPDGNGVDLYAPLPAT